MSGIIKTLAKVGMRDNTIKRHLMKREQLCWFLRAISFIRETVFFLEIENVLITNKEGLPCASQVLRTAMCDCIALTDMRVTGFDCFRPL